MKLSEQGYKMICGFEGVRNDSYQDVRGIWTCGIGFIQIDGNPITKGMHLTNEQIENEFRKQIITYENEVNMLVISNINQNQFDSLVSFTYNLGVNAFKGSTLLKKINSNPLDPSITNEFKKWVKAKNIIIKGIVLRRTEEALNYWR